MTDVLIIQGRELRDEDIGLIRELLAEHPQWCRTQLSKELCRRWDWRNAQGLIKDMACRTRRLDRVGPECTGEKPGVYN